MITNSNGYEKAYDYLKVTFNFTYDSASLLIYVEGNEVPKLVTPQNLIVWLTKLSVKLPL